MKKILPLVIAANLLFFAAVAQVYIEPIAGYQLDINNKDFKQINSAVQIAFKKNNRYEFILAAQVSWPLSYVSGDSAFTANSSLPVYAPAEKTILPGSFSFSAGHRIVLAGRNSANKLSLLINTGFTAQKIKVRYAYDKNNYTILNPDQTQQRVNIYVSGGLEYMHLLKSGRLFFQINIASPPAGKQIKYPSSFKFMAPLNFNAGYSIPIKK